MTTPNYAWECGQWRFEWRRSTMGMSGWWEAPRGQVLLEASDDGWWIWLGSFLVARASAGDIKSAIEAAVAMADELAAGIERGNR